MILYIHIVFKWPKRGVYIYTYIYIYMYVDRQIDRQSQIDRERESEREISWEHLRRVAKQFASLIYPVTSGSTLRNTSQLFATLRNSSQLVPTLRNSSQLVPTLRNSSLPSNKINIVDCIASTIEFIQHMVLLPLLE